MNSLINVAELVKRVIKYLVEGLMVAIAAYAIPKRSLNIEEVILIALTAAATFSILDTYIPSMGATARSGAGFGIGANGQPDVAHDGIATRVIGAATGGQRWHHAVNELLVVGVLVLRV